MKSAAFVVSLAIMLQLHKLCRLAVIGSSRGLGAALVEEAHSRAPAAQILGVSRRVSSLPLNWVKADVSKPEGQHLVISAIEDFRPELLVVCVGGGPYGPYGRREWKDHVWAFETTFSFPARLLYWALNSDPNNLQQLVLVGSSVAESLADPGAASYAAAKHALRGLFQSVVAEKPALDVRLFSPGYMDTELLPKGSAPRERRIWNPRTAAQRLLNWCETGHRYDHHRLAVFCEDK